MSSSASSIILKTYTEQKIKVTTCMSNMAHNQPWPLVLVIVNGNGPSLFGPETGLNTSNTLHVNHNAHPKFYKPYRPMRFATLLDKSSTTSRNKALVRKSNGLPQLSQYQRRKANRICGSPLTVDQLRAL